jgi:hypothetical protein
MTNIEQLALRRATDEALRNILEDTVLVLAEALGHEEREAEGRLLQDVVRECRRRNLAL